MFDRTRRFSTRAVPILLGLGAAGLTIGAGQAGSTSDGPLRCEIHASSAGGMVSLEGVVLADVEVSGSYRFRVASAGGAGGSNIQQGGDFTAGPGGAVTLGEVMLGGQGAVYDATLEINSGGASVKCAERVGGAI
jgi:CsgH protein